MAIPRVAFLALLPGAYNCLAVVIVGGKSAITNIEDLVNPVLRCRTELLAPWVFKWVPDHLNRAQSRLAAVRWIYIVE